MQLRYRELYVAKVIGFCLITALVISLSMIPDVHALYFEHINYPSEVTATSGPIEIDAIVTDYYPSGQSLLFIGIAYTALVSNPPPPGSTAGNWLSGTASASTGECYRTQGATCFLKLSELPSTVTVMFHISIALTEVKPPGIWKLAACTAITDLGGNVINQMEICKQISIYEVASQSASQAYTTQAYTSTPPLQLPQPPLSSTLSQPTGSLFESNPLVAPVIAVIGAVALGALILYNTRGKKNL